MMWALAALLTVAAPAVAASSFAPADGVALRYTIVDERSDGATVTRFTSARRVVFRKTATGYRAELTILSVGAVGVRDLAAMSRRLMSALVGRTIRYQLDSQGAVIAVEDQAALIALIVATVGKASAAGTADSAARADAADKFAASLAAMPEAAQRDMLASFLSSVIDTSGGGMPGRRAVVVPMTSSLAQPVSLPGSETVGRTSKGWIAIDTEATGPITSGAGQPQGKSGVRITRHREIDPATGLVMLDDRRTETWLGSAPMKKNVIRSLATLAIE